MRVPRRVGIDLDGVLIDHHEHMMRLAEEQGISLERWQTNTNLIRQHVAEEPLRELQQAIYTRLTPAAPAVVGSIESLPSLKAELFLISARRADTIRFAQDWLVSHRVYDVIPAERIFFCGSDEEKRGYCERLGLDAFLDDRVSVLDALPGRTARVLFDEDGVADRLNLRDRMQVAATWPEFLELVRAKVTATQL